MAKALVVYATITGNNEDVADMVTGAWRTSALTLK